MAYTKIDIFHPHKEGYNVVLDIVEQNALRDPESTAETANPKSWEESVWVGEINMVNTVKMTKDTDNDETEGFDRHTTTRIKEKNTRITATSYEFELTRTNLLVDALAHGIPNPTSDEALAGMSADSTDGAPIFATDNPYVPVCIRVKVYSSTTRKLAWTEYFYAQLLTTGEVSFDGKIHKPVLTAELQTSKWNRKYNTADHTGQVEEEETTTEE